MMVVLSQLSPERNLRGVFLLTSLFSFDFPESDQRALRNRSTYFPLLLLTHEREETDF